MTTDDLDKLITVLWVLGSLVFLAVVGLLCMVATASVEDFKGSDLMEDDNV